jgi:phage terminase small subunit
MARRLTLRQTNFIEEYRIDGNGTQAALRAGYSTKASAQAAHELLRNPKIIAELRSREIGRFKTNDVTADRVLKELARVAFSDPRKLFKANGSLKAIHELDDDEAAMISQIDVVSIKGADGEPMQVTRVRLWDKNSGLEKLGKHLKLFHDAGSGAMPTESASPSVAAAREAIIAELQALAKPLPLTIEGKADRSQEQVVRPERKGER